MNFVQQKYVFQQISVLCIAATCFYTCILGQLHEDSGIEKGCIKDCDRTVALKRAVLRTVIVQWH